MLVAPHFRPLDPEMQAAVDCEQRKKAPGSLDRGLEAIPSFRRTAAVRRRPKQQTIVSILQASIAVGVARKRFLGDGRKKQFEAGSSTGISCGLRWRSVMVRWGKRDGKKGLPGSARVACQWYREDRPAA